MKPKVYRRAVVVAVFLAVSLAVYWTVQRHADPSGPEPSKNLPLLKTENQAAGIMDPDFPKIVDDVQQEQEDKDDDEELDQHQPEPVTPDSDTQITHVEFVDMDDFKKYDMRQANQLVGRISMVHTFRQKDQSAPQDAPGAAKESATFISLVRNLDFAAILKSIESVEARFNSKYHYDWVFVNNEPFAELFKSHVASLVSGEAKFVELGTDYWLIPSWIDLDKFEQNKQIMKQQNIKYGDSVEYRHMCRFFLGFFAQLPVMKQYKYFWRVEPDIKFHCDMFETDWFKYMRLNDKKYAFALAPLELHKTVNKLWQYTRSFMDKYPPFVNDNNALEFLTDDDGGHFNMCHFWSNFEIGDLDFFRLEAYQTFFKHLDQAGGFYYSRWGDAPIHSIAVAMLLLRTEIAYLEHTGYSHRPNSDCPKEERTREALRCTCSAKADHTWSKFSCVPKWYEINELDKPDYADFEFRNPHRVEDEKDDQFNDW